jgi:hypothetical protein
MIVKTYDYYCVENTLRALVKRHIVESYSTLKFPPEII